MRYRPLVAACLALALGACTQTIAGPGQSAPATAFTLLPQPVKATTTADMLATAANFDNAVSVGYTDLTNFQACQHLINQLFGVEVVPGAAPVPTAKVTNAGVISGASIAIIDAVIAKSALQSGVSIPENCVEAAGELTIQNIAAVLGGAKVTFTPALTAAQVQAMLKPTVVVPVPAPMVASPSPAPAN